MLSNQTTKKGNKFSKVLQTHTERAKKKLFCPNMWESFPSPAGREAEVFFLHTDYRWHSNTFSDENHKNQF